MRVLCTLFVVLTALAMLPADGAITDINPTTLCMTSSREVTINGGDPSESYGFGQTGICTSPVYTPPQSMGLDNLVDYSGYDGTPGTYEVCEFNGDTGVTISFVDDCITAWTPSRSGPTHSFTITPTYHVALNGAEPSSADFESVIVSTGGGCNSEVGQMPFVPGTGITFPSGLSADTYTLCLKSYSCSAPPCYQQVSGDIVLAQPSPSDASGLDVVTGPVDIPVVITPTGTQPPLQLDPAHVRVGWTDSAGCSPLAVAGVAVGTAQTFTVAQPYTLCLSYDKGDNYFEQTGVVFTAFNLPADDVITALNPSEVSSQAIYTSVAVTGTHVVDATSYLRLTPEDGNCESASALSYVLDVASIDLAQTLTAGTWYACYSDQSGLAGTYTQQTGIIIEAFDPTGIIVESVSPEFILPSTPTPITLTVEASSTLVLDSNIRLATSSTTDCSALDTVHTLSQNPVTFDQATTGRFSLCISYDNAGTWTKQTADLVVALATPPDTVTSVSPTGFGDSFAPTMSFTSGTALLVDDPLSVVVFTTSADCSGQPPGPEGVIDSTQTAVAMSAFSAGSYQMCLSYADGLADSFVLQTGFSINVADVGSSAITTIDPYAESNVATNVDFTPGLPGTLGAHYVIGFALTSCTSPEVTSSSWVSSTTVTVTSAIDGQFLVCLSNNGGSSYVEQTGAGVFTVGALPGATDLLDLAPNNFGAGHSQLVDLTGALLVVGAASHLTLTAGDCSGVPSGTDTSMTTKVDLSLTAVPSPGGAFVVCISYAYGVAGSWVEQTTAGSITVRDPKAGDLTALSPAFLMQNSVETLTITVTDFLLEGHTRFAMAASSSPDCSTRVNEQAISSNSFSVSPPVLGSPDTYFICLSYSDGVSWVPQTLTIPIAVDTPAADEATGFSPHILDAESNTLVGITGALTVDVFTYVALSDSADCSTPIESVLLSDQNDVPWSTIATPGSWTLCISYAKGAAGSFVYQSGVTLESRALTDAEVTGSGMTPTDFGAGFTPTISFAGSPIHDVAGLGFASIAFTTGTDCGAATGPSATYTTDPITLSGSFTQNAYSLCYNYDNGHVEGWHLHTTFSFTPAVVSANAIGAITEATIPPSVPSTTINWANGLVSTDTAFVRIGLAQEGDSCGTSLIEATSFGLSSAIFDNLDTSGVWRVCVSNNDGSTWVEQMDDTIAIIGNNEVTSLTPLTFGPDTLATITVGGSVHTASTSRIVLTDDADCSAPTGPIATLDTLTVTLDSRVSAIDPTPSYRVCVSYTSGAQWTEQTSLGTTIFSLPTGSELSLVTPEFFDINVGTELTFSPALPDTVHFEVGLSDDTCATVIASAAVSTTTTVTLTVTQAGVYEVCLSNNGGQSWVHQSGVSTAPIVAVEHTAGGFDISNVSPDGAATTGTPTLTFTGPNTSAQTVVVFTTAGSCTGTPTGPTVTLSTLTQTVDSAFGVLSSSQAWTMCLSYANGKADSFTGQSFTFTVRDPLTTDITAVAPTFATAGDATLFVLTGTPLVGPESKAYWVEASQCGSAPTNVATLDSTSVVMTIDTALVERVLCVSYDDGTNWVEMSALMTASTASVTAIASSIASMDPVVVGAGAAHSLTLSGVAQQDAFSTLVFTTDVDCTAPTPGGTVTLASPTVIVPALAANTYRLCLSHANGATGSYVEQTSTGTLTVRDIDSTRVTAISPTTVGKDFAADITFTLDGTTVQGPDTLVAFGATCGSLETGTINLDGGSATKTMGAGIPNTGTFVVCLSYDNGVLWTEQTGQTLTVVEATESSLTSADVTEFAKDTTGTARDITYSTFPLTGDGVYVALTTSTDCTGKEAIMSVPDSSPLTVPALTGISSTTTLFVCLTVNGDGSGTTGTYVHQTALTFTLWVQDANVMSAISPTEFGHDLTQTLTFINAASVWLDATTLVRFDSSTACASPPSTGEITLTSLTAAIGTGGLSAGTYSVCLSYTLGDAARSWEQLLDAGNSNAPFALTVRAPGDVDAADLSVVGGASNVASVELPVNGGFSLTLGNSNLFLSGDSRVAFSDTNCATVHDAMTLDSATVTWSAGVSVSGARAVCLSYDAGVTYERQSGLSVTFVALDAVRIDTLTTADLALGETQTIDLVFAGVTLFAAPFTQFGVSTDSCTNVEGATDIDASTSSITLSTPVSPGTTTVYSLCLTYNRADGTPVWVEQENPASPGTPWEWKVYVAAAADVTAIAPNEIGTNSVWSIDLTTGSDVRLHANSQLGFTTSTCDSAGDIITMDASTLNTPALATASYTLCIRYESTQSFADTGVTLTVRAPAVGDVSAVLGPDSDGTVGAGYAATLVYTDASMLRNPDASSTRVALSTDGCTSRVQEHVVSDQASTLTQVLSAGGVADNTYVVCLSYDAGVGWTATSATLVAHAAAAGDVTDVAQASDATERGMASEDQVDVQIADGGVYLSASTVLGFAATDCGTDAAAVVTLPTSTTLSAVTLSSVPAVASTTTYHVCLSYANGDVGTWVRVATSHTFTVYTPSADDVASLNGAVTLDSASNLGTGDLTLALTGTQLWDNANVRLAFTETDCSSTKLVELTVSAGVATWPELVVVSSTTLLSSCLSYNSGGTYHATDAQLRLHVPTASDAGLVTLDVGSGTTAAMDVSGGNGVFLSALSEVSVRDGSCAGTVLGSALLDASTSVNIDLTSATTTSGGVLCLTYNGGRDFVEQTSSTVAVWTPTATTIVAFNGLTTLGACDSTCQSNGGVSEALTLTATANLWVNGVDAQIALGDAGCTGPSIVGATAIGSSVNPWTPALPLAADTYTLCLSYDGGVSWLAQTLGTVVLEDAGTTEVSAMSPNVVGAGFSDAVTLTHDAGMLLRANTYLAFVATGADCNLATREGETAGIVATTVNIAAFTPIAAATTTFDVCLSYNAGGTWSKQNGVTYTVTVSETDDIVAVSPDNIGARTSPSVSFTLQNAGAGDHTFVSFVPSGQGDCLSNRVGETALTAETVTLTAIDVTSTTNYDVCVSLDNAVTWRLQTASLTVHAAADGSVDSIANDVSPVATAAGVDTTITTTLAGISAQMYTSDTFIGWSSDSNCDTNREQTQVWAAASNSVTPPAPGSTTTYTLCLSFSGTTSAEFVAQTGVTLTVHVLSATEFTSFSPTSWTLFAEKSATIDGGWISPHTLLAWDTNACSSACATCLNAVSLSTTRTGFAMMIDALPGVTSPTVFTPCLSYDDGTSWVEQTGAPSISVFVPFAGSPESLSAISPSAMGAGGTIVVTLTPTSAFYLPGESWQAMVALSETTCSSGIDSPPSVLTATGEHTVTLDTNVAVTGGSTVYKVCLSTNSGGDWIEQTPTATLHATRALDVDSITPTVIGAGSSAAITLFDGAALFASSVSYFGFSLDGCGSTPDGITALTAVDSPLTLGTPLTPGVSSSYTLCISYNDQETWLDSTVSLAVQAPTSSDITAPLTHDFGADVTTSVTFTVSVNVVLDSFSRVGVVPAGQTCEVEGPSVERDLPSVSVIFPLVSVGSTTTFELCFSTDGGSSWVTQAGSTWTVHVPEAGTLTGLAWADYDSSVGVAALTTPTFVLSTSTSVFESADTLVAFTTESAACSSAVAETVVTDIASVTLAQALSPGATENMEVCLSYNGGATFVKQTSVPAFAVHVITSNDVSTVETTLDAVAAWRTGSTPSLTVTPVATPFFYSSQTQIAFTEGADCTVVEGTTTVSAITGVATLAVGLSPTSTTTYTVCLRYDPGASFVMQSATVTVHAARSDSVTSVSLEGWMSGTTPSIDLGGSVFASGDSRIAFVGAANGACNAADDREGETVITSVTSLTLSSAVTVAQSTEFAVCYSLDDGVSWVEQSLVSVLVWNVQATDVVSLSPSDLVSGHAFAVTATGSLMLPSSTAQLRLTPSLAPNCVSAVEAQFAPSDSVTVSVGVDTDMRVCYAPDGVTYTLQDLVVGVFVEDDAHIVSLSVTDVGVDESSVVVTLVNGAEPRMPVVAAETRLQLNDDVACGGAGVDFTVTSNPLTITVPNALVNSNGVVYVCLNYASGSGGYTRQAGVSLNVHAPQTQDISAVSPTNVGTLASPTLTLTDAVTGTLWTTTRRSSLLKLVAGGCGDAGVSTTTLTSSSVALAAISSAGSYSLCLSYNAGASYTAIDTLVIVADDLTASVLTGFSPTSYTGGDSVTWVLTGPTLVQQSSTYLAWAPTGLCGTAEEREGVTGPIDSSLTVEGAPFNPVNTGSLVPCISYDDGTTWTEQTSAGTLSATKVDVKVVLDDFVALAGSGTLAHWDTSADPATYCAYAEMTCNGPTITALDLSSHDLTGAVPATITLLDELTTLLLNDNNLGGVLPVAVPPSLTTVDLSTNAPFTCNIPTAWTDLGVSSACADEFSVTVNYAGLNDVVLIGDSFTVDIVSNIGGMSIGSSGCVINDVDVASSLVEATGTYTLTYTLQEGEANWAAGALAISCGLYDSGFDRELMVTSFDAVEPFTSLMGFATVPSFSSVVLSSATTYVGDGDSVVLTLTQGDSGVLTTSSCTMNAVAVASFSSPSTPTEYEASYTASLGDTLFSPRDIPMVISCTIFNEVPGFGGMDGNSVVITEADVTDFGGVYGPIEIGQGLGTDVVHVSGVDTVTISGTNLDVANAQDGGAYCRFGPSTYVAAAVAGDGLSLSCTTPLYPADLVGVQVSLNGIGTDAAWYATDKMVQFWRMTSITPSAGFASGGTTVSLYGENLPLSGYDGCFFGDVNNAGVFTAGDGTNPPTCESAAHVAGTVSMYLTSSSTLVTDAVEFTFYNDADGDVASVTPPVVQLPGGDVLTVAGNALPAGLPVLYRFGAAGEASAVVESSDHTMAAPPHAAGEVGVQVSVDGGQNWVGDLGSPILTYIEVTGVSRSVFELNDANTFSVYGHGFPTSLAGYTLTCVMTGAFGGAASAGLVASDQEVQCNAMSAQLSTSGVAQVALTWTDGGSVNIVTDTISASVIDSAWTLNSLTPSHVPANSGSMTVTVSGSNFVDTGSVAVVTVDADGASVSRAVTLVDVSSIEFTLGNSDAGTLSVEVSFGSARTESLSLVVFEATRVSPQRLSESALQAGSTAILVSGSGFSGTASAACLFTTTPGGTVLGNVAAFVVNDFALECDPPSFSSLASDEQVSVQVSLNGGANTPTGAADMEMEVLATWTLDTLTPSSAGVNNAMSVVTVAGSNVAWVAGGWVHVRLTYADGTHVLADVASDLSFEMPPATAGTTVDVELSLDGGSTYASAQTFTYFEALGIAPRYVLATGSEEVTVTGDGFSNGASYSCVLVGTGANSGDSDRVWAATYHSDTELTCVVESSGALVTGDLHVALDGSSGPVTASYPLTMLAPYTLSDVTPHLVTSSAESTVTLVGVSFADTGSDVRVRVSPVDGAASTELAGTFETATTISVVLPPYEGTRALELTLNNFASPNPTGMAQVQSWDLDSAAPSVVVADTATTVLLYGHGFTLGAATCVLTGSTATSVGGTAVSSTEVQCPVTLQAGVTNFQVEQSGLTTERHASVQVLGAYSIASLLPDRVVAGQSQVITITGANFADTGALAVSVTPEQAGTSMLLSGVSFSSSSDVSVMVPSVGESAVIRLSLDGGAAFSNALTLHVLSATDIAPRLVTAGVATPFEITGSGFDTASAVSCLFVLQSGGSPDVVSATVDSPTVITCDAVSLPIGVVEVTVTADGVDAVMAVTVDAIEGSTLSAVDPPRAPSGVSAAVSLLGSLIADTGTVLVRVRPLSQPDGSSDAIIGGVHVSTSEVTAEVPSFGESVMLAVSVDAGQTWTNEVQFDFFAVHAVSPEVAVSVDPVEVTVEGVGFSASDTYSCELVGTGSSVGTNFAVAPSAVVATRMTCSFALDSIVSHPYTCTVAVVRAGASTTDAVSMTVYAPPTLTSVAPPRVPSAGSTTLTLTGSDFEDTGRVRVRVTPDDGSEAAMLVPSVVSPTAIEVAVGGYSGSRALDVSLNAFATPVTPVQAVAVTTYSVLRLDSTVVVAGQSVALVIRGSGFDGASVQCAFTGSTTATVSATVDNDAQVTCAAHAFAVGDTKVNVVVGTVAPYGELDLLVASAYSLDSINPVRAASGAAVVVTLTGTDLTNTGEAVVSVSVEGGNAVTLPATVTSTTEATVELPSFGSAVMLSLSLDGGRSFSTETAFVFFEVLNVSPQAAQIRTEPDVEVVVRGLGSLGSVTIKCVWKGASDVETDATVVDGTQAVQCRAPGNDAAIAVGEVPLSLSVGGVEVGTGTAFRFYAEPTVTSLTPRLGPVNRDFPLVLLGSELEQPRGDLDPTIAMRLGTSLVSSDHVVSSGGGTRLDVTVPAHTVAAGGEKVAYLSVNGDTFLVLENLNIFFYAVADVTPSATYVDRVVTVRVSGLTEAMVAETGVVSANMFCRFAGTDASPATHLDAGKGVVGCLMSTATAEANVGNVVPVEVSLNGDTDAFYASGGEVLVVDSVDWTGAALDDTDVIVTEAGGQVVLTAPNFAVIDDTGVVSVRIGDSAAGVSAQVSVNAAVSPAEITFAVPFQSAGARTVFVSLTGQPETFEDTGLTFTYVADPSGLFVSEWEPRNVPLSGGTTITLSGNFPDPNFSCRFKDGDKCVDVTGLKISLTEMHCAVPSDSQWATAPTCAGSGKRAATQTGSGLQLLVSSGGTDFTEPLSSDGQGVGSEVQTYEEPVVTAMTPAVVPNYGGQSVMVLGEKFPDLDTLSCVVELLSTTLVFPARYIDATSLNCTFDAISVQGQLGGDGTVVRLGVSGNGVDLSNTIQFEVTTCAPGSFQSSYDMPCELCEPGTYNKAPSETDASCVPCPDTRYADSFGMAECIECDSTNPDNYVVPKSGAVTGTSKADCGCREHYYDASWTVGDSDFPGDQQRCVECPAGGDCEGATYSDIDQRVKNARPVPSAGFWAADSNTVIFLECPAKEEACKGGAFGNPSCDSENGYTGRLCSECEGDFYHLGEYCEPCPNNAAFRIIGVIVAFVIIVPGLIWLSKRTIAYFVALSIGYNYWQVIALLSNFEVEWPRRVGHTFELFSIANFNIDLLATECSVSVSWQDKWLATLFLPVALALGLMSVWTAAWGWKAYLRSKGRSSQFSMSNLRNTLTSAYLLVLLLTYVRLTESAVQLFDCTRQDDGTWTLDADPATTCYGGEWYRLLPVAVIAVCVYMVGIPCVFMWILFRHRHDLDNEVINQRFGFLYSRYYTNLYWWEIGIQVRKLIIILCQVFLTKHPMIAVVIALATLFACTTLQLRFSPFLLRRYNIMEFILLVCSSVTLFSGLLFFSGRLSDAGEDIVVVIVLLLVFGSSLSVAVMVLSEVFFRITQRALLSDEIAIKYNLEKLMEVTYIPVVVQWARQLDPDSLAEFEKVLVEMNKQRNDHLTAYRKYNVVATVHHKHTNMFFKSGVNRMCGGVWKDTAVPYLINWLEQETRDNISHVRLLFESLSLFVAEREDRVSEESKSMLDTMFTGALGGSRDKMKSFVRHHHNAARKEREENAEAVEDVAAFVNMFEGHMLDPAMLDLVKDVIMRLGTDYSADHKRVVIDLMSSIITTRMRSDQAAQSRQGRALTRTHDQQPHTVVMGADGTLTGEGMREGPPPTRGASASLPRKAAASDVMRFYENEDDDANLGGVEMTAVAHTDSDMAMHAAQAAGGMFAPTVDVTVSDVSAAGEVLDAGAAEAHGDSSTEEEEAAGEPSRVAVVPPPPAASALVGLDSPIDTPMSGFSSSNSFGTDFGDDGDDGDGGAAPATLNAIREDDPSGYYDD